MTEARLLLARNLPLINGEYKWQIIHPQRRGMPVPLADHPSNTNIISANPSVIEFMVDLVGVGGPWDGWRLHALGDRDDGIRNDWFYVVLVRDTAPVPSE